MQSSSSIFQNNPIRRDDSDSILRNPVKFAAMLNKMGEMAEILSNTPPANVQSTLSQKTTIVFPPCIGNDEGYSHIQIPFQGLMRSPAFLAFINKQQKELDNGSVAEDLLKWTSCIQANWNTDKLKLLASAVKNFQWMLHRKNKNLPMNPDPYTQFLIPFLQKINFIPTLQLQPTGLQGIAFTLYQHRDKIGSHLEKVIFRDFHVTQIGWSPSSLIIRLASDPKRFDNCDLQFPKDGLIAFNRASYQLNSFTHYRYGHYSQCLYLDGKWFEYDEKKEELSHDEFEEKWKFAFILFFDRVEKGYSEIVEKLSCTKSVNSEPSTPYQLPEKTQSRSVYRKFHFF